MLQVHIRKIKLLKQPKFDLGALLAKHNVGGGTDDSGQKVSGSSILYMIWSLFETNGRRLYRLRRTSRNRRSRKASRAICWVLVDHSVNLA